MRNLRAYRAAAVVVVVVIITFVERDCWVQAHDASQFD